MRLSTKALEEEVRGLLHGVSTKFVAEPSPDQIKNDLLIALKRYCYAVRARARKVEQNRKATQKSSPSTYSPDAGLGTDLRPTNGWLPEDTLPSSNKAVEHYLRDVQFELLSHVDEMMKKDIRKRNSVTKTIESILYDLHQRDDVVVVPTDKTNSYVVLQTTE